MKVKFVWDTGSFTSELEQHPGKLDYVEIDSEMYEVTQVKYVFANSQPFPEAPCDVPIHPLVQVVVHLRIY